MTARTAGYQRPQQRSHSGTIFNERHDLNIGILGAGSIGSILARKLSSAGHNVKIANSRGPHTIDPSIVAAGVRAVEATDVITGIEVLIISVPLSRVPAVKTLITDLPNDVAVIDTSNYYPLRDGHIQALDEGQAESVWVAEQLGRPVAKAWNAILAGSLEAKGMAAGAPGLQSSPANTSRQYCRLPGKTSYPSAGTSP